MALENSKVIRNSIGEQSFSPKDPEKPTHDCDDCGAPLNEAHDPHWSHRSYNSESTRCLPSTAK